MDSENRELELRFACGVQGDLPGNVKNILARRRRLGGAPSRAARGGSRILMSRTGRVGRKGELVTCASGPSYFCVDTHLPGLQPDPWV